MKLLGSTCNLIMHAGRQGGVGRGLWAGRKGQEVVGVHTMQDGRSTMHKVTLAN